MRTRGFQFGADGIETIGIYKRAARKALATGAKTIEGIQKAAKDTLGTFKADYLNFRTALIQMMTEGDVIFRNGAFELF